MWRGRQAERRLAFRLASFAAPRRGPVEAGRRSEGAPPVPFARPRLDGTERGATLDAAGLVCFGAFPTGAVDAAMGLPSRS